MQPSRFSKAGGRSFLTLALCAAPLHADGPIDGRELFTREWLPGDPRAGGGDGLGPVFNDSSCAGCHNQGGTGGGGTAEKNVHVITPFARTAATEEELRDGRAFAARQRYELARRHPGFRSERSVVLHRFGVDDDYAEWRRKLAGFHFGAVAFFDGPMQGFARREQVRRDVSLPRPRVAVTAEADGPFQIVRTERNAPALFGAGAIDAIPDEAILAAAASAQRDFPEISGRAARLKDGRIGRFGWKAQKARLHDFVLNACAVELGLQVPGEPQAGDPLRPDYTPAALDLTAAECEALTRFVAALPTPGERPPGCPEEAQQIAAGRDRFQEIGCGACHRRQLGPAMGIYSDLLLHDMGPDLGDSSSYGTFVPNATEDEELAQPLSVFNGPVTFGATGRSAQAGGGEQDDAVGARRLEWRTPPLWGVRDSAPYLHDARAATLEEAIAMHGGEGQKSSQRFFDLPAADRRQVIVFLKSLVAP